MTSSSEKIKQQIAFLEQQGGTKNSTKLPPVLKGNSSAPSVASSSTAPARYVVKFAHIPSEAFYCTAKTWRELCSKTQQVWGIDQPYFTFATVNALDRQVSFRLTCAADFESVWSNPEAPAMQADQKMQQKLLEEESSQTHRAMSYVSQQSITAAHKTNGGQFFGKVLLAHDHRQYKNVAHSGDFFQYGVRPFVSAGLLSYWPVRYVIRHTATDEVMFVSNSESSSWGYAVQKCQSEWGVLRPLFRYVDDIEGERTIISVVTAEDYILWYKRRRALWPELLVFEHAAPQLLSQYKEELLGVAGKYLRDDDDDDQGRSTNNTSRMSQNKHLLPQFENMPDASMINSQRQQPSSFRESDSTTMKRNKNVDDSSNPQQVESNGQSDVPIETENYLRLSANEKRLMQAKKKDAYPLFSSSYHSMGISPLEPDVNRGISYYPSKTAGFPIANNNNNNNNPRNSVPNSMSGSRNQSREGGYTNNQYSNQANALLSTFRSESLQTKTEWEKVQEERQYQTLRAKHMRELEKALLTGDNNNNNNNTSSPRRGNL